MDNQFSTISARKTCWSKYVYTFILFVCCLSNAFIISMIPPALIDLSYQLKISVATASFIYLFMSIGFTFGTLVGVLLKYLNRQLTFIVLSLMSMVCTPLIVWVTTVWPVFLCVFLIEVQIAVFDCGLALWVIEMWPNTYSPIMYFINAFYTCGMFISPLMVAPFIEGDVTKFTPNLLSLNKTTRDAINYSIDRRQKLVIPFLIAAAIIAIIPFVLSIMFIFKRYKYEKPDQKQEGETSQESHYIKSPWARKAVIILIAVSLAFNGGLTLAHTLFSPTFYQFLPIGISAERAAHILSVVSVFYTMGRLLAVFESMKVSVDLIISLHLVFGFFAQILLYLDSSLTIIWIANAVHGLAYAPLYMAYLLLAEKYLKLNETMTAILVFSDEALKVTYPFLIGPVIEKNPYYLQHYEICCWLVSTVAITLTFIIIKMNN